MSDADPELGPLLRRALLDRRAPENARMRLMAARPRRRAWVAGTAAAGLLIAALGVALLLRAPRQPRVAAEPKPEELVRISEKHRPRSAQGVSLPRGEAQTAVEKNLGQDASTPSAERAGFEIVDVEAVEEGQVVQIVYRRADTTLSAFVMKPERFRRAGPFQTRDGVDFRSFSCRGRSTVIVKAGAVCRVWVADIPEAQLVETVLEIEKQRASLQKVRLHLEGAGWRRVTRMVRDALRNLKGVLSSEVDWETGDAVLLYDETVVAFEAIKQVFERAGFTVTKHTD